jgi:hypothetical protein
MFWGDFKVDSELVSTNTEQANGWKCSNLGLMSMLVSSSILEFELLDLRMIAELSISHDKCIEYDQREVFMGLDNWF